MFYRIALVLLSAAIGAAVAAVFTTLTSAAAFLAGMALGSKLENEETETPELS